MKSKQMLFLICPLENNCSFDSITISKKKVIKFFSSLTNGENLMQAELVN